VDSFNTTIHTSKVAFISPIPLAYNRLLAPLASIPTEYYNTALEILGLDEDATAEDCKAAYRRLALSFHPDKCKDLTSKPLPSPESTFLNTSRGKFELIFNITNEPTPFMSIHPAEEDATERFQKINVAFKTVTRWINEEGEGSDEDYYDDDEVKMLVLFDPFPSIHLGSVQ
jgi:hypothetical protein